MNRNEIATASRYMLNEFGTQYVGTTMLYSEMSRAAEEFNLDAGLNRIDATVSIKTGAREYAVTGSTLDVYRVRLGTGSQRRTLEPISPHQLARETGDWEAGTSGTPTRYYFDGNYMGFDVRPRARTAWTNGATYAAGDIVIPSATDNGFYYKCATAGTSGGSEPTWPATISGTVGDNGIVWQQAGSTRVYLRSLQNPSPLAYGTSVPSWCQAPFHRTIAKKTVVNIAGAFGANDGANAARVAKLYTDYQADVERARGLNARRSREYVSRITPKHYKTFWR